MSTSFGSTDSTTSSQGPKPLDNLDQKQAKSEEPKVGPGPSVKADSVAANAKIKEIGPSSVSASDVTLPSSGQTLKSDLPFERDVALAVKSQPSAVQLPIQSKEEVEKQSKKLLNLLKKVENDNFDKHGDKYEIGKEIGKILFEDNLYLNEKEWNKILEMTLLTTSKCSPTKVFKKLEILAEAIHHKAKIPPNDFFHTLPETFFSRACVLLLYENPTYLLSLLQKYDFSLIPQPEFEMAFRGGFPFGIAPKDENAFAACIKELSKPEYMLEPKASLIAMNQTFIEDDMAEAFSAIIQLEDKLCDKQEVIKKVLESDSPACFQKCLELWGEDSSSPDWYKLAVTMKATRCIDYLVNNSVPFSTAKRQELAAEAGKYGYGEIVAALCGEDKLAAANFLFSDVLSALPGSHPDPKEIREKMKSCVTRALRFSPISVVDSLMRVFIEKGKQEDKKTLSEIYAQCKSDYLRYASFIPQFTRKTQLQQASQSEALEKESKYGNLLRQEAEVCVKELQSSKDFRPTDPKFAKWLPGKDGKQRFAALLEKFVKTQAKAQVEGDVKGQSAVEYPNRSIAPISRTVHHMSTSVLNKSKDFHSISHKEIGRINSTMGKSPNVLASLPELESIGKMSRSAEILFEEILKIDLTPLKPNASKAALEDYKKRLQDFDSKVAELVFLTSNLLPVEGETDPASWVLGIIQMAHGLDLALLKNESPPLSMLGRTLPLSDFKFLFPQFFQSSTQTVSSIPSQPLNIQLKNQYNSVLGYSMHKMIEMVEKSNFADTPQNEILKTEKQRKFSLLTESEKNAVISSLHDRIDGNPTQFFKRMELFYDGTPDFFLHPNRGVAKEFFILLWEDPKYFLQLAQNPRYNLGALKVDRDLEDEISSRSQFGIHPDNQETFVKCYRFLVDNKVISADTYMYKTFVEDDMPIVFKEMVALSTIDKNEFIKNVLQADSPECFKQCLLLWSKEPHSEILKNAVENCATRCISYLINNYKVDQAQKEALAVQAGKEGQAEVVLALTGNDKQAAAKYLFSDVAISLKELTASKESYEKFETRIQCALRFSSFDVVDSLISAFIESDKASHEHISKIYQQIKAEYRRIAPFISQYNKPWQLQDLHENYTEKLSSKEALKNDIAYAKYWRAEVENIVKLLHAGDLMSPTTTEFLALCSESKSKRYAAYVEHIAKLRSAMQGKRSEKKIKEFAAIRNESKMTPMTGRYRGYRPIVRCLHHYSHDPDFETTKTLYLIRKDDKHYPGFNNISGHNVFDVRFGEMKWQHGNVTLKKIWPILEEKFKEILDMKGPMDENKITELYNKLIELNWLTAQATPLDRGTGTVNECGLGVGLLLYDVEPPVLSKDFPQLDANNITFGHTGYQKVFFNLAERQTLPPHLQPPPQPPKMPPETPYVKLRRVITDTK